MTREGNIHRLARDIMVFAAVEHARTFHHIEQNIRLVPEAGLFSRTELVAPLIVEQITLLLNHSLDALAIERKPAL